MAEKPAYIVVNVDIHDPEIYQDYIAHGGMLDNSAGISDIVEVC